jgi:hypothetical protein
MKDLCLFESVIDVPFLIIKVTNVNVTFLRIYKNSKDLFDAKCKSKKFARRETAIYFTI